MALGLLCVSPVSAVCGQPVLAPNATVAGRFRAATEVERVLPQSSVYDMLEDRQGFLWFATREGLARWDGYAVRTWKHDPFSDQSLPGNVVRTVREDRYGHFWVAASNYLESPAGVVRISGAELDVVEYKATSGQAVVIARDGQPVMATADSVFAWDSTSQRFHAPFVRAVATGAVDAPRSEHLYVTNDSTLWLIDVGRGVEACNLSRRQCRMVTFDTTPARAIFPTELNGAPFERADGTLWFGLTNGVATANADRTRISRVPIVPHGVGVASFTEDDDGTLWLLTEQGVVELPAGTNTPNATHALMTLTGEPNLAPTTIHRDRAGTIWVGTVWGVYRRDPMRKAFAHLGHDPLNDNSLSAGLVTAIAEDGQGDIWIGTIGGGLNRWNRTTGTITRFRHNPLDPRSLSHDIVWDVVADPRGDIWAGTSYGLNRFDRARNTFTVMLRDPTAPRSQITNNANTTVDLESDGHSRLWMTRSPISRDSVLWFDLRDGAFHSRRVLGVGYAGYIRQSHSGALLLGTDAGIRLLDTGTMRLQLPSDTAGGSLDGVLSFLETPDGSIWVGANSGLYHFDSTGQRVARYSTNDGLPSSAVFGLLADDVGRIWMSTNRGLATMSTRTTGSRDIRTYDYTTGLRNVEFNRNAYHKTRDGTILFGGDRGVTYFSPSSIATNPYRPPVVFTAVHLSTQRGTRTTRAFDGRVIRIAPQEYTFTIDFAALSFINPHRNKYQVRLEGFNDEWIDQGAVHSTTYTNVPPGSYLFHVRAANEDGVWTNTPAALSIVVEPYFWQTLWFQITLLLLGIAGISAGTWYLSRSRYRLALQRERAARILETERSRISRDMHDEVGASLTEISILSELAQRTSSADHLTRIGQKSRATLDAIGEIIWAIDPQNDRGARFVAYLRAYAAEFAENVGLETLLTFPEEFQLPDVSADIRRTVFLVLKEALANSAKHARATTVTVHLSLDNRVIQLRIHDDGCGFAAPASTAAATDAASTGHHGLRNMRARAAMVNGTLLVNGETGSGTVVTLSVPLSPHTKN